MKKLFIVIILLMAVSQKLFSQNDNADCQCQNANTYIPYNVSVTASGSMFILKGKINNPLVCELILRINSSQAIVEGGTQSYTIPPGTNGFEFSLNFTAVNYNSVSFSYNTRSTGGTQCSNSNFNVELPKTCSYTLSSSGNIVTITNTCNQNLWFNFYGPPECTVSPAWVQVMSGASIEQPIIITQISPNLMDPVSVFYKVFNADKSVMCDHKNVKIPKP